MRFFSSRCPGCRPPSTGRAQVHAPDPPRPQPAYNMRLYTFLRKITLAAMTNADWRQNKQPRLRYCSRQKPFPTENLQKEKLLLLPRLHFAAIEEVCCFRKLRKILQLDSIARCNPPVRPSQKTNRFGFFTSFISLYSSSTSNRAVPGLAWR